MRTDNAFFDVDFLIQQSGHSNVDIYHGTIYLDDNPAGGCYASGDIVNAATGDKGTLNIISDIMNGYYEKCNLNITLEHYDPIKDINNTTSMDKIFLVSILNGLDMALLIEEHSLLLMDPSRVEVSNEPAMAVLAYESGFVGELNNMVNVVRDIFYQNEDFDLSGKPGY
ncbi:MULTISPECIES: hypothetical protein [Ehrlichia]|uniref:Uncharacterized protein n=1 Tax=Ehrlichia cf. muris str. EmCRT TaxID=1359167 RepID=A0A0F3N5Z3_9RICK|nr:MULTISPECIES: hypothetical protein [Ehrlichia]KJV63500.1 hypothetical protein EMUCRT_0955 [Ehrlichia cf. muris str. EmCRT]OUC04197.1 hypothetical protein DB91_03930 [Ehrlichia sp. Wisconsin_h]